MAKSDTESHKIPKLLPDGSNYVLWHLHTLEKLAAEGIEPAIHRPGELLRGMPNAVQDVRSKTQRQLAKARSIIRLSLCNELKTQTMNLLTPFDLWFALDERFMSMRNVLLPQARADWHNLRVCDQTLIHSCELYRIMVLLDFCGQRILELPKEKASMKIFEDNESWRKQMLSGYIKSDRIKHLAPKLFYAADLQEEGIIKIELMASADILTDIVTMTIKPGPFKKLVHELNMRHLHSL